MWTQIRAVLEEAKGEAEPLARQSLSHLFAQRRLQSLWPAISLSLDLPKAQPVLVDTALWLEAPHAAAASRLRQMLPTVVAKLAQEGFEIKRVRLRVCRQAP